MSELQQLKPAAIWRYFDDICAIPHPSGQEQALRNYVLAFARQHNLESEVDGVGNIVVRKAATVGMADRAGVVLQSHLDMVPQKNEGTDHDFAKDSIQPWIDGEWVKARGTTLGADNGVGMAAALAVLAATDLAHGPLEALFTVDEERSMTGAFALQPGWLNGDILLNLDTEEEGELYVGCAGGINVDADGHYVQEAAPANCRYFQLTVKGLKGGHSGCDIHLQRGNANKIMVNLLKALQGVGARIATVRGGSLANAIPREAFATIAVPKDQTDKVAQIVDQQLMNVRTLLAVTDGDVSITAQESSDSLPIMALKDQQLWLDICHAIPNGVDRMSESVEGVVETSNNFAIMIVENGEVAVRCFARSLIDSCTVEMGERIAGLLRLSGAEVVKDGLFPGWKPNSHSPMLAAMQDIYNDLFGKVPTIRVIHAGLECGLLSNAYPNWDMISIGPTIRFPHSPDEQVHIGSVEKFWTLLTATLAQIPAKV